LTGATSAKLENLNPGTSGEGLTPNSAVNIVKVGWFGDQAVKAIFEEPKRVVGDGFVEAVSLRSHGSYAVEVVCKTKSKNIHKISTPGFAVCRGGSGP